MRVFLLIVLALAGTFQMHPAVSQTSPPPELNQLLQKVAAALRKSNYRGRLTYEHSGRLEVVDIEHRVVDGVEHELIRFLNGPEQELIKTGRQVDCSTKGGLLFSGGSLEYNGGLASLSKSYRVHYLGSERVAGRDSWVVQMISQDDHRHSFVLAVDQASYLPTKTLYVTRSGKPLERLHFVSLEAMNEPPASAQAEVSTEPLDAALCSPLNDSVEGSGWKPSWVPSGFVQSGHGFSASDGYIDTYTDGLAAFSIIATTVSEGSEALVMQGNFAHLEGATVIVMRLVKDGKTAVRLALVGEIPGETAQRILRSVEQSRD